MSEIHAAQRHALSALRFRALSALRFRALSALRFHALSALRFRALSALRFRALAATRHTGQYLCLALLAFAFVAITPALAEHFEFDPRRTEVRFAYTMGFSTGRGRFTQVGGSLELDDAQPEKTSVSASITTASLTTGEPLVDAELKGVAFFNAKTSPVIAFKSRTVQPLGDGAADVLGDITVNGITRPVTLKVTVQPHDDPALKHDAGARAFVAKTRIQRSAFNMTDYQSMVSDDVDIEINAIVRPRK